MEQSKIKTEISQEEIQAELAERFEVPCQCVTPSGRCSICMGSTQKHSDHCRAPDCRGSGVRYPFRRPCPGLLKFGEYHCYVDFPNREDDYPCPCSGKLGYVFNPDPDVLWEAVRAKGWSMRHECHVHSTGDYVFIFLPGDYDPVSMVNAEDGLRGQAALQTALWKTLPDQEAG